MVTVSSSFVFRPITIQSSTSPDGYRIRLNQTRSVRFASPEPSSELSNRPSLSKPAVSGRQARHLCDNPWLNPAHPATSRFAGDRSNGEDSAKDSPNDHDRA